jgi:hypothetical protein
LVVSKIAVLGVEVIHIPGGCMGLCQPLDVGINKLFKHHCHLLWKDWMMNIINTDSVIREAMCKEVAAWTAEVFWDMMGKKFLKNECDRRWDMTGSRVWLRRKVWMVMATRTMMAMRTMMTRHMMTAMMTMTTRHMTTVRTMRNGKTGNRMGHKTVNVNILAATKTMM